jgi:cellulose synthase/poly-beta-1,6-N-acetylglucosamine synthase-like glycosyltransferase
MEVIGTHKRTKRAKAIAVLLSTAISIALVVSMAVIIYNPFGGIPLLGGLSIYSAITNDEMLLATKIIRVIGFVFSFFMAYRVSFLMIFGLFFKAKTFPETDKRYRYACLIPARDEAMLIGNLIDSLKKQNYPQDMFTMFVIADDCTDNTAEIARSLGATVFERIDPPMNERRKGYALDFLIKRINEEVEGGIAGFDGVFILDADTIFPTDFFHEMNKAFDRKEYDFYTNYSSPKNMTNLLSAYGGISSCICNNAVYRRPMGLFGFSPRARGSALLLRSHLLKDGWKWHALVEDREFSLYHIAKGVRSTYVESAEVYDEIVEEFKMFNRQRMRLIHGSFVVFWKYLFRLLGGLFTFRKRSFRQRFSCYDAMVETFPFAAVSLVLTLLGPLIICIVVAASPGLASSHIMDILETVLIFYVGFYFQDVARTLVSIMREHRRVRIKPLRLALYTLLFPFIAIYTMFLSLYSLFIPVKWKRIKRYGDKTAEEVADEKILVDYIKGATPPPPKNERWVRWGLVMITKIPNNEPSRRMLPIFR